MITINELIAELQKIVETDPANGDLPVILQKDSEGNGYSPMVGAEYALYEAESKWSGQVYSIDDEYTPEDAGGCVVFWPTN